MTRQDAAGVLGVSASASRSVARAAMLSKVNQLIAVQGLSPQADEVAWVELAYSTFCSSAAPSTSSSPARAKSSSVPSRPESSRSWVPIVIVVAILAAIGLFILIAASSGSANGSGSSSANAASSEGPGSATSSTRTSPSPQEQPADTGVTGEVGSCWNESPAGSSRFLPVGCDSPSADVKVHKETRDPNLCPTQMYFRESGWFLCLMNV